MIDRDEGSSTSGGAIATRSPNLEEFADGHAFPIAAEAWQDGAMTNSTDPTIDLFMVEVRVADWSASSRWYVDVLGLRPVLEDRGRQFMLLDAGSGRLALKGGPAAVDRSAVRLIFQVGDVDEARARLIGLGVEVSPPSESDEGYREVRLLDPEGTPIHLFAWVGREPPETERGP